MCRGGRDGGRGREGEERRTKKIFERLKFENLTSSNFSTCTAPCLSVPLPSPIPDTAQGRSSGFRESERVQRAADRLAPREERGKARSMREICARCRRVCASLFSHPVPFPHSLSSRSFLRQQTAHQRVPVRSAAIQPHRHGGPALCRPPAPLRGVCDSRPSLSLPLPLPLFPTSQSRRKIRTVSLLQQCMNERSLAVLVGKKFASQK